MKQELLSLIICTAYQHASMFPFVTPNSVLKHIDAITLIKKRQKGPICERESHKTILLVLFYVFYAHVVLLRLQGGSAKIPMGTF